MVSADAYFEGEMQDNSSIDGSEVVESLLGGNTYAGIPLGELPEHVAAIQNTLGNPALGGQLENLLSQGNNTNAPKAHLNVLFFNDALELIPGGSTSVQVPEYPMGANDWVVLNPNMTSTACCVSDGPGYVIIYVDNQSIGKKVWFDNITVEHYTSEVLDENHYYPFGLTLSIAESAQGSVAKNPHKYNSKELEKAFALETYDYGARLYSSQTGRWFGIDEEAESYIEQSPYNYVGNNPIRRADIDGRDWLDKVKGFTAAVIDNATGIDLRGSFSYTDAKDYNTGQDAGDVASLLGGIAEGYAGTSMTASSVGVAVTTGGTAAIVAVPTAAVGIALTAHGTMVTANSTANFASQKGRVSEGKTQSEGVIYKRSDKTGKQKDYVGQAKSEERYKARQREHQRANPDAKYKFEQIDRGKPGKDLNQKEQKHLDKMGGPTNKSNPNGGTSNKKNVIKKK